MKVQVNAIICKSCHGHGFYSQKYTMNKTLGIIAQISNPNT